MTSNLKRAFLIGYAYALGYEYGRRVRLAQDENDNHDPDNGQFAPKGTGTSSGKEKNPEDISHLLKPEMKGVKGRDAVFAIYKAKSGYVKDAFHHKELGDIGLFWGNSGIGLKHIIEHRIPQNIPIERFLNDLADVVETGTHRWNSKRSAFEIWKNGNLAVIYPSFKGNDVQFVFTAYRQHNMPSWMKKKSPQS